MLKEELNKNIKNSIKHLHLVQLSLMQLKSFEYAQLIKEHIDSLEGIKIILNHSTNNQK